MTSKVQHGYKGSSNDLTVTNPHSAVFTIAHGFKYIIHNTVKCYNFILGKHSIMILDVLIQNYLFLAFLSLIPLTSNLS